MGSVIRKEVNKVIGDKLRELREARDLTQEQLASGLGTDPHYIIIYHNLSLFK